MCGKKKSTKVQGDLLLVTLFLDIIVVYSTAIMFIYVTGSAS